MAGRVGRVSAARPMRWLVGKSFCATVDGSWIPLCFIWGSLVPRRSLWESSPTLFRAISRPYQAERDETFLRNLAVSIECNGVPGVRQQSDIDTTIHGHDRKLCCG